MAKAKAKPKPRATAKKAAPEKEAPKTKKVVQLKRGGGATKTEAAVESKTSQSQKFRDQALTASRNIDVGYIDLSEALFSIKRGEFWNDWGIKNFKDYCEIELQMDYGKAQSFINIWDKMKDHSISRTKLEGIGWTKVREILKVADTDEFDELLRDAKKLGFREIDARVRTILGKMPPGVKSGFMNIRVQLGTPQAKTINESIELGKKIYETDDAGIVLAAIVGAWITESGLEPKNLVFEDAKSSIEKAYGIKIDAYSVLESEEEEDDDESEETEEESSEEAEEEDDDSDDDDSDDDEDLDDDDLDED